MQPRSVREFDDDKRVKDNRSSSLAKPLKISDANSASCAIFHLNSYVPLHRTGKETVPALLNPHCCATFRSALTKKAWERSSRMLKRFYMTSKQTEAPTHPRTYENFEETSSNNTLDSYPVSMVSACSINLTISRFPCRDACSSALGLRP